MRARIAMKAIPPITEPTITGVFDEEFACVALEDAELPFVLGLAAEPVTVAEGGMSGPPVSTESAEATVKIGSYNCVIHFERPVVEMDEGT